MSNAKMTVKTAAKKKPVAAAETALKKAEVHPVRDNDTKGAKGGTRSGAISNGVKITAAKGRPMLTWVGKRPLSYVTAFPAQHVETFDPSVSLLDKGGLRGVGVEAPNSALWKDWPSAYPKGGLLFHGDNKEVLAHLLANGFRGKVNLIYSDPLFDSGADYVRKVTQ